LPGERDDGRGRSVRRLAEQFVRQIPLSDWCAKASATKLVGGTPTGAVETTALRVVNCIVQVKPTMRL